MTRQCFITKSIISIIISSKVLTPIQRASCTSRSWIISAVNSQCNQPHSPCLAWTHSVQVESSFVSFLLTTISPSPGIISLNVSLVDPPELIHLHLSEMPIYSPVFYLCDRVFSLTLLLHDRDYYHQARVIRYLARQLNSAEFILLQSGLNISNIYKY